MFALLKQTSNNLFDNAALFTVSGENPKAFQFLRFWGLNDESTTADIKQPTACDRYNQIVYEYTMMLVGISYKMQNSRASRLFFQALHYAVFMTENCSW